MDISFSDAYQNITGKAFQIMAKPRGSDCNLNCSYCYYLEKKNLYPNALRFYMTDEILENFIKQYIESQESPVIEFIWQGGEPLLAGIDFFEKVVFYQKKYSHNKKIANAFQTNGTILNEEWCKFFARNNFLTGISIDGPEHLHNKYRKYASGKQSFSEVMKGIEMLIKYNVPFNTLSVVNDMNSHYPLEVYNYLKSIGSTFMQFIPVVEQKAVNPNQDLLQLISPDYSEDGKITEWSVKQGKYGDFLIAIFDEWIKKDVGRYFIQIFDATLANWAGENPGLCVFQKTCGNAGVIEYNGDVYSCDHYVYPGNYLGNISIHSLAEMMYSQKQSEFGLNKYYNLPQQCLQCDYLFACRGGCPKNRTTPTEEKDKNLNYMCNDYYNFFKHVTPAMNFMAGELKNERPPAGVMEWANKHKVK